MHKGNTLAESCEDAGDRGFVQEKMNKVKNEREREGHRVAQNAPRTRFDCYRGELRLRVAVGLWLMRSRREGENGWRRTDIDFRGRIPLLTPSDPVLHT